MALYDWDTGTTRDLTREVKRSGARLVGYTWVGDGHLIWGQAVGPLTGADPLRNAVVREEDLRTGTVWTLAEHAAWPKASWPWVAWTTTDGSDEHTVVTSVETGQQEHLVSTLHFLALHGGSAAYNTMESHVVCLIEELATGVTVRPIVADPDTYYEWITINDRAVGFAQQSLHSELGKEPTQVYVGRLDVLVDLPMVVGFSETFAVGPLVVWATPTEHWDDPFSIIQVVDTRDITP